MIGIGTPMSHSNTERMRSSFNAGQCAARIHSAQLSSTGITMPALAALAISAGLLSGRLSGCSSVFSGSAYRIT
jgi:hypothetical protein